MSGILRIPQQMPRNQREWEAFTRKLNAALTHDGSKAILDKTATLSNRTSTDFETVLQRIGDNGRATDQRLVPMVNFGNVSSVQSTEPLSATAGSTTATISIAAHTLYLDFDSDGISYNSGSCTGLSLNTRYYVYADDPDHEGGAVTYVATTSRQNVTAKSGRYLVGSITTPVSANTANISGATSANPIVFTTSAAHGWEDGNTVEFAGLPGDFGDNLNGNEYEITIVDSDEFSIDVDGSAFDAYTSGGTATRVVPNATPDVGGGGGGFLP